jgi:hypothetical protein
LDLIRKLKQPSFHDPVSRRTGKENRMSERYGAAQPKASLQTNEGEALAFGRLASAF